MAHCEKCRMVSSMPQLAPHHPWQYLSSPWDRVHIDYGEHIGIHFLVLVDAYSKWPEVCQVSTTTSRQTVEILAEIFAMHGFPRIFVSDNGPQFSSAEFAAFLTSHHILHHTSAPYHPVTNGLDFGHTLNLIVHGIESLSLWITVFSFYFGDITSPTTMYCHRNTPPFCLSRIYVCEGQE